MYLAILFDLLQQSWLHFLCILKSAADSGSSSRRGRKRTGPSPSPSRLHWVHLPVEQTKRDLERKEAAGTEAAIRLRSVREQYEIELQILDANQKQKQTQLEIDKIRNDAAKAQNVADIAEAEAKVAATEASTDLTPGQKKLQLEADRLNLEAKEQQKEALAATDFALEQQQEVNQRENQAQLTSIRRRFTVDELGAKAQLADSIVNPTTTVRAKASVRNEAYRELIGTDNPDEQNITFRQFNRGVEATEFRDRFGNPLTQQPLETGRFQPQLQTPQLKLPPIPGFQNIRQEFGQTPLQSAAGNNELIQAIGCLEVVMKQVQSPVLNQTNSTTNNFEAGAVDNGDFARKIEQQQRHVQYQLLQELQRRASWQFVNFKRRCLFVCGLTIRLHNYASTLVLWVQQGKF